MLGMNRFCRHCRLEFRSLVRSTWMAPLLCPVLSAACMKISAPWRVEDLAPGTWGYAALILVSLVAVLSFLLLLLCTVCGYRLSQGRGERVWRLIVAAVAGVLCLTEAVAAVVSVSAVTEAHVADAWRVPEGVSFDVPDGLSADAEAPAAVKRLFDAAPAPEISSGPIPEGEPPARAAHAEMLAQQHPELLRELWWRSLMLRNKKYITAKAMQVQDPKTLNGIVDATVLLHPAALDAERLLARLGDITSAALALEEGRVTDDGRPLFPVTLTEEVGKGWQLSYAVTENFRPCRHAGVEALARYRMDCLLAELATAPTVATLDRLLPVQPCPGLLLRDEAIGYGLTLCLPKDIRTDGHYDIRAYEYETGTPLKLDERARGIRPTDLRELSAHRLLRFEHFELRTGRRHQYYGSRWQIIFVPDKGQEEVLSEQLFLLQGKGC